MRPSEETSKLQKAHHDLKHPCYTPTDFFTCTFGDIRRRDSRNTTNTDTRNDSSSIDLPETFRAGGCDGSEDLQMITGHRDVMHSDSNIIHRSDAEDDSEDEKSAYTSDFC